MQITASLVKELRERSGAGMMECKKALTENAGNIEAAADWLRATGLVKADKKATRIAAAHPAAAFVIAKQSIVLAEEPRPVAPDRAFQVVFQVAQPVGRLDQYRPAAERRPGQARAVAGGQVADRLLHAAIPEGNRSAV